MMKKILLLFLLFIQLPAMAEDKDLIVFLRGGRTDIKFSFFGQLITGDGLSLGYKSSQPWDIWDNPASLVTFNQSYFNLNFQPQLNFDPNSLYDIDADIIENVDDAIKDYRDENTLVDYPVVQGNVGQKGDMFGFQLVIPLSDQNSRKSVMTFSLSRPVFMDFEANNDGFDTLIRTTKAVGDQNKIINLRMNAVLYGQAHIKASQYAFGFSHLFSDRLAVGVKLGRTLINTKVNGQVKLNGIMETAGTEYAFNDPYDPRIDFEAGETNKLDQNINADFSGQGWNAQFGFLTLLTKSLVLGLDANIQESIVLTGNMEIEQYKIPALNMDALSGDESDEDLIDPVKLDLAKLTLTEKVDNKVSRRLSFQMPSSVGLQLSRQGRVFEAVLGFRKYIGRFGYNFLDTKYQAHLNYGVDMDIILGGFNMSLGAIKASLVNEEEFKIVDELSTWMPHGSLGFEFFLLNNIHVGTKLFVTPTPGLGIKLGYFF